MVTRNLFMDAILYSYALSLLFYFSDFAYANRSAKRVGTGLLAFVWVLQGVYFAYGVFERSNGGSVTLFESLFLFSWLLVTLSLVIRRFFQIEMFVFFVNVVGFIAVVLHMFNTGDDTGVAHRWGMSESLLFVHVALAVCSYAAFCISAIFSGMHLYLHRSLKDKAWSARMQRLPSLDKTDRYANAAIVAGAPLLLLSLLLGLFWISKQDDAALLADAKVISSFFTLGAYVFYLVLRRVVKLPGNRLALWNVLAFVIVVLNFIVTNVWSGFHHGLRM